MGFHNCPHLKRNSRFWIYPSMRIVGFTKCMQCGITMKLETNLMNFPVSDLMIDGEKIPLFPGVIGLLCPIEQKIVPFIYIGHMSPNHHRLEYVLHACGNNFIIYDYWVKSGKRIPAKVYDIHSFPFPYNS